MTIKEMKIKEITVSLSGVVPTASYENLRPGYSMTIEPQNGNADEIFTYCENYLRDRFNLIANQAKTDLIEKQYSTLRFYEKNGKKYPSVTSILGWNTDWHITEDQLNQYGARGTIIHKLIEEYLKTGEWVDPRDIPELREEVAILMIGSLNLTWETCSYKAFMKKYGNKITDIQSMEEEVFNDEALYAGRYDLVTDFDGVKSVVDFKGGTSRDMRQLAAYAVCEKDIKQLVICPVGETDNKTGFMRPVVCDTIQDEYKSFLKARAKFRQQFGI